MTTIAVLMSSFNRRDKTLECLAALYRCVLPPDVFLDVILVDDGSSDGTASAVSQAFPRVRVILASGNLYWARAMYLAFDCALSDGYDYYLWLNDDTILFPQAVRELINTADDDARDVMVVGAVQDPHTFELTYGGACHIGGRWRPFLCTIMTPSGVPIEVDVANGNVLLIPHGVAAKLGNINPAFEHGMADTDYSMRAKKLGIAMLLTPSFVGQCPRNALLGTFRDGSLSMRKRMSHAFSRKGLPIRSWWIMCRSHGGIIWPVHFLWAYVKVIMGKA